MPCGKVRRVNRCVALVLACIPAFAGAERLFNIPTASKTKIGDYKFGVRYNQHRFKDYEGQIGFGISDSIDAEATTERIGNRTTSSMNLSYNLLTAFPDLAPGLSIGLRDILDNSRQGRSAYFAFTFKVNQFGTYNQNTPLEVTIGAATGGMDGMFFGAMIPFVDQFRLIAEHDTLGMQAGLEIRPTKDLSIQWMFRREKTQLGFGWSMRF